jgi:hypothetical protein
MRRRGALAQLVEQRPEEPCVPSSSLGGATTTTLLVNPDFINALFYAYLVRTHRQSQ